VAVVETDDLRTEADREDLDGDAAPARHEEVTELVEKDHDGEDEEEGQEIAENGVAEAGRKVNYRVHDGSYPRLLTFLAARS
jgi:hypothetical protein